ncbi:hypothetical protein [uncultured Tateyamaria sp.]|uniref:head-tail joining protein n=1 Tax=uncultured Tateyamaria sp. TaxID=455651 RepID=UPI00261DBE51|nr:hypothetical protein [uncultured Tateyamaria sp.]
MSLFDGVAGVLADVFGAPVIYTPKTGEAVQVQATLRHEPTEVVGDDGRVTLITSPTLRVSRAVLANPLPGDVVALAATPEDAFEVLNKIHSGSPAADAVWVCELAPYRPPGGGA